MKRLLLLFGVFCLIGLTVVNAKDSKKSEKLQFKSVLVDQDMAPTNSAYPTAFSELNNPASQAAITTGYYFVDNDKAERNTPDFWKPIYDIADTNLDRHLWKQITTGPRQKDSTYWTENPDEGLAFFRNPAIPGSGKSYFKHGIEFGTDSTDNAIAGPIPLGLAGGFYFNGLRYDSFYVSTNGIVALTNRRYFYNSAGEVTIPPGSDNAYDPMSMDWFARTRTGTGLEPDRLPDDFGYQYSVLGNAPTSATAGIRMNGSPNGLAALSDDQKAAVIAPFWGSSHLSQWNPSVNIVENHGRVYFKRSNAADKLTIYFVNVQPLGYIQVAGSGYNATKDARIGIQNHISACAQIVLNRLDSSITIHYKDFVGNAVLDNGRSAYSQTVFQHSTTTGVKGFARHVNYNRAGEQYPWANEYGQVTLYNNRITNVSRTILQENLAVRFKQWKNTLRVVDIQYRVRKQDPTADLSFSDSITSKNANNYELLAGEERIGALQPVVIMQNLTNDIQGPSGVNYTPQELNFQARFRIVNQASKETVYSSIIPITDSTLKYNVAGQIEKVRLSGVSQDASGYHGWPITYPSTNNYEGIPPYSFVQIFFRPFEPSEIEKRNHGRLRCFIIAEPYNPITKEGLGDEWPFDDTTKVNIFVMTRLNGFKDDVTEFHYVDQKNIPSVLKWVSVGTEVFSGDEHSVYPLPPRGEFSSANLDPLDDNKPYSTVKSPVIRVDRLDEAGNNPDPMPGGDQLRSFPINLADKANPVLTLSVQRSIQRPDEDWVRGFSDQKLIGPEPRVIVNFSPTTEWTNQTLSASRWTDYLKVEFAYPSPDGIQYITNIPDAKWTTHKTKSGSTLNNVSAFTLCGAGGHTLGFLLADKDSALTTAQGLVSDIYDDGFDWDYKKIYLPIPSYILNAPNNAARNFRFRIRCYATDYKAITQCMNCIPDDDDPFFVDNVAIISTKEEADIEISSVRITWPYTAVPASQALQVPVSVRLANNTSLDSKSFLVRVVIEKSAFAEVPGDTVYCNQKFLNLLRKGATFDLDMDYWNAAKYSGAGDYVVKAQMYYVGNSDDLKDIDSTNDKNYKQFNVKFSDVFAYEKNPTVVINDVPEFTKITGRGLNMFAYNSGGNGNQASGYTSNYDNNIAIAGAIGGSGSGQIAVKFKLAQADTIYGYKAYFSSLSQNSDNITFVVYKDRSGLPSDSIAGTTIRRERGLDDERNNYFYNQFVTYKLDSPKLLNAGTYWVSIAQLGAYNLELGASKSRVGMRTTNVYIQPPVTGANRPLGAAGVSLLVDKNFRRLDANNNLVNENYFAFENSKGSGNWEPFMPTVGNPAFGHLDHFGRTIEDDMTYTLTRGTWIPMLRPYLGMKNVATVDSVDCDSIPIELLSFDGQARSNGIELFWETATEKDNKGFYVDRAVSNENAPDWSSIAFVDGAGNSNSIQHYNYTDKSVQNNTTYLYRLRQIDNDGSQSCGSITEAIEISFNYNGDVVLEQNAPNPFTESTKIYFRLVKQSDVKLEIVDIFGNTIRTLANGVLPAQLHEVVWSGDTESGAFAPAGTYVYRLTVGNEVKIGKMTLVR